MKSKEAQLQSACVAWFRLAYPNFSRMLFAIPNGGSRNKVEAANLKRQGVTAGVPDLFLSVASGNKHGMYIEMKYGRNKLTDDQEAFLEEAMANGYGVAVCWTFDDFKDVIENYLSK